MMAMPTDPDEAGLRGFIHYRLAPFLDDHPKMRGSLRRLSLAGLIPVGVWRRLAAPARFDVRSPHGHRFHYEAAPGDEVAVPLYWTGCKYWEAETLEVFSRLAARSDVCVDVGAYTGVYTLLAAADNPAVRVIALEPVPEAFAQLELGIAANRLEKRCSAVRVAASDSSGIRYMWTPVDSPLSSITQLVLDQEPTREGRTFVVETVTLDELLNDEPSVDLMKLDVEGAEDKVLLGSLITLRNHRPTIVLECLPGGPGEAVTDLLRPMGYRLFYLGSRGPVEVEAIDPGNYVYEANGRYRNWLCVGRPETAQILALS